GAATGRLRLDDLEGDADVAGDDRRQGFFDHCRIAIFEPIFGKLGRHTNLERVLLAADERGILQPGLVAWLTELEPKFLLRRLPDLFPVHTVLQPTRDCFVGEQSRYCASGREDG